MKPTRLLPPLLTALGMTFVGVASADAPGDTIKPNFSHALPNIPGKSLTAVEVTYAPGGASMPHRHAQSAFIYAYVVSGRIVSQVAGEPERTYSAGETWYEMPGAHHVVSRNASGNLVRNAGRASCRQSQRERLRTRQAAGGVRR